MRNYKWRILRAVSTLTVVLGVFFAMAFGISLKTGRSFWETAGIGALVIGGVIVAALAFLACVVVFRELSERVADERQAQKDKHATETEWYE